MASPRTELVQKKERLALLVEQRSKANCDTRHLSPADIKRETDIEELEEEILALEKKLGTGGR
jgi:hypothetical protein